VDVGLEVLNHVKFPVRFYLFFCSYLWVCFHLKRLFLVRDFPTLSNKSQLMAEHIIANVWAKLTWFDLLV